MFRFDFLDSTIYTCLCGCGVCVCDMLLKPVNVQQTLLSRILVGREGTRALIGKTLYGSQCWRIMSSVSTAPSRTSYTNLSFHDIFTKEFPADPETENQRRKVVGSAYSVISPTPVAKPTLLGWSGDLAKTLGLPEDPQQVDKSVVEWLTGNRIPEGVTPWAHVYGGFQFGNWAGQLGDGRAINVGTVLTVDAYDGSPKGGRIAELQLKGSGETPYSRFADGRAVLRSSIREFVASEAMAALGIPTTRALSITLTGEGVDRDQFYNGNVKAEPGAVVCRVAPSFLRFGSIEWAAANDKNSLMEQYIDYTIRYFYPELQSLPKEER